MRTILLNNGIKIPQIGFGTYQLLSAEVDDAIRYAIECGYRMIDTATVYRNEAAIGKTLKTIFKEGGISRSELFITSKLGPVDQGYDSTVQSVEESLKKLQLDYIDLYLIHWPGTRGLDPQDSRNAEKRKESWQALEELVAKGKLKSIGVSNYLVSHLKELLEYAKIVPAVNQFELHPCLYQKELIDFCEKHRIAVEAYSSLGRGELLKPEYEDKYPIFRKLKMKYSRPFGQVLLRWVVQHDWIVIPKSKSAARIAENFDVFNFELTKEEMAELDEIGEKERFCWDPHSVK